MFRGLSRKGLWFLRTGISGVLGIRVAASRNSLCCSEAAPSGIQGNQYEPDFVCYDRIVLVLKAVKELADEHRAQLQNYLKATGLKLGLLVNFGHYPKIEVERIVNTRGQYG